MVDYAKELIRVLDAQDAVNRSVVRAMEAMALQADKYDAEIALLEDQVAALDLALNKVESRLEIRDRHAAERQHGSRAGLEPQTGGTAGDWQTPTTRT